MSPVDAPGSERGSLPEQIRTKRLWLRAPMLADAKAIFQSYGSDPEATRFMPWEAHQTVEETRDYLQSRLGGMRDGTHHYWLMVSTVHDTVIGMIGLVLDGTTAEVGFILARTEWGKGYATEALRAVIDATLGTARFERIWGYCDLDNVASARVMEKVGMERERVAPRFASFSGFSEPRDAAIYAVALEARPQSSSV